MSGNNTNTNIPGMNFPNMMQQQGNAGLTPQQQQQQRMMQLQFQQQQQQMQQMQLQQQFQQHQNRPASNTASSMPLSSPPNSLSRPPSLAPSPSTGSLARNNSSSSVNSKGGKGAASKQPPVSRGASHSDGMVPPPTLKKATSGAQGGGNNNSNTVSDQMTQQLLSKCDWKDRTLWVSRQILGGNATNGFMRSTATVQRIKRQRARQTAQSKQKAAAGTGADDKKKEKEEGKDEKSSSNKKRDVPDQAAEEELKKEVMNPRTAKKIKAELQAGLGFCVTLHNTIRSILMEMDPQVAPHTPLPLHQGGEIPTMKALMPGNPKLHPAAFAQAALSAQASPLTSKASGSAAATAKGPAAASLNRPSSDASLPSNQRRSSGASQASPGEAGGSTLRKNRKKKLPPSNEKPLALSEFDASGKRMFSKKDHTFRVFEAIRFRALNQGDFVAARVTSRDLWILARVQKDYPGFSMPPSEFLKLTEAKRDACFREKVQIKDVEDKGGAATMVPRNLVLPLPRTFSEAAEWCKRCKKDSRVYAMYPHTTSLYAATVIDSTTYCRQDDDIIVVEFDGDEPDATGLIPKYHIPARFVTLIPREFPSSQPNNKKRKSVTTAQAPLLPNSGKTKRSSVSSTKSANSNTNNQSGQLLEEDPLGSMIGQMGFEDLVSTNSLDDLEQFDFDFSDER